MAHRIRMLGLWWPKRAAVLLSQIPCSTRCNHLSCRWVPRSLSHMNVLHSLRSAVANVLECGLCSLHRCPFCQDVIPCNTSCFHGNHVLQPSKHQPHQNVLKACDYVMLRIPPNLDSGRFWCFSLWTPAKGYCPQPQCHHSSTAGWRKR